MLLWWKGRGKTKYWDVFVAGLPTMALPAANAYLERKFSTATFGLTILSGKGWDMIISRRRRRRGFSWESIRIDAIWGIQRSECIFYYLPRIKHKNT
eukprot:scaffold10633_cov130-Skeletonema_menzelii.AAC.3